MFPLLGFVAIVSVMVTVLTYTPKEGFISGDAIMEIMSGLTPEQIRKSEMLNDPKLFKITDQSLEINMPVVVDTELRIVGRDARLEMITNGGNTGGIGLDHTNADQAQLNVIPDKNKGNVSLKFYIIKKDGSTMVTGLMAGHVFRYQMIPNVYIPGHPLNYNHPELGLRKFNTKEDALYACDAHAYCKGVTYDKRTRTYELRGKNDRIQNGAKAVVFSNRHEDSFVKIV